MTSLVAWIGVDSRGPSSIYIATDSRISWQTKSGITVQTWDSARKTSAVATSPQIFGFAGDVFYPSQTLEAVSDLLTFYPVPESVEEAQDNFQEAVRVGWQSLPPKERRESFLVQCLRVNQGMNSRFGMQVLHQAARSDKWTAKAFAMPDQSSQLEFLGSGTKSLKEVHARWVKVPTARHDWPVDTRARTSRAVFSAFCDSLDSGSDPASGGAPQLVGLYREGNGRRFGIHWHEKTYVAGTEITDQSLERIEWRNRHLERIDQQGRRLGSAQRHSPTPVA